MIRKKIYYAVPLIKKKGKKVLHYIDPTEIKKISKFSKIFLSIII